MAKIRTYNFQNPKTRHTLPDEFRNDPPRDFHRTLTIVIVAATIAALILFVASLLAPPATPWVTKSELHRLQRYHGTVALKITDLDVSIWRDHRWIVVRERFPEEDGE